LAKLRHLPSTHATILRTNSGSSCRWLRMIPSLGTNAAADALPERDASGGKANLEMDRIACIGHGGVLELLPQSPERRLLNLVKPGLRARSASCVTLNKIS
jgi:hypothetical protein